MNINIDQNLLSIVPLKSQFTRSTRIDQDKLDNDSFIYSGSIDLFLNTLASHQESKTPQGAFTWTFEPKPSTTAFTKTPNTILLQRRSIRPPHSILMN